MKLVLEMRIAGHFLDLIPPRSFPCT